MFSYVVGIAAFRRVAQARRLADDRLIHMLPEALRPHEGLVVKAAGNEARERAVERTHIESQRRPAVLAHRLQPVEEFHLRGAQIGLVARTIAYADKRVHFLRAEADNPARTVILETAAEKFCAIGHNGGGQRVAGKTVELLAVKTEMQLLRAVNAAAALGQAVRLVAHDFASAFSLSLK